MALATAGSNSPCWCLVAFEDRVVKERLVDVAGAYAQIALPYQAKKHDVVLARKKVVVTRGTLRYLFAAD